MGAILSHPTTVLHPLAIIPGSVQQTRGPVPGGDPGCPICQEPFRTNGANLEHTKCRRRFHEECLRKWLPDGTSCPLCRVQIVIRDLWEIDKHDRAEFVRQARQRRAEPSEYYVMSNIDEIISTIRDRVPSVLRKDVIENMKSEIILADDMFDVLGPQAEPGALKISDLLQTPSRYLLDSLSIDNLWVLSRLLGITHVFLATSKYAREVGFWVPILPYYDVMTPDSQVHHMSEFYARSRSTIVQVPLSSTFIRDRLGLKPGFRHETVSFSDIMTGMNEVAEDGDMTFSCVFDFPSRNGGSPEFCLVP